MTRIWFLSDLHQEFLRDPEAGKHPLTRFDLAANCPSDVDAIVIAGDLDVSLENSLRRIADELGGGPPVLYVPGNHDFYTSDGDQFTLAEMKARGDELAEYLGITLLQNSTVHIGDTRFIGSTLWTDFESVGRGFLRSKTTEAEGRDGMNDYRYIKRESTATPGKRKRIRPQDTIAEHRIAREYIESELQKPHTGETVVVTHHAPHPLSLDPAYDRLNYAYASNLSSIMEEPYAPDLWLHGHIHQTRDYQFGRTRVVANPRGYAWDEQNDFDPGLVLEIGEPVPKWGL